MTNARGFTLIEAIAVIVITGIIAAVIAVFIARPVEGYVDATRRAILSDLADNSLRRMARDIRLAVPNSVRVSGTCGVGSCYLEYIPTSDGVRYRTELSGTASGDILDFNSGTDNSFDVYGVSAIAAAANDFLVIFNTGQCLSCADSCSPSGVSIGANAYQGCNRRTLTVVATTGVSFTATNYPLPFDSPGHRVNFVPATGPASYACENIGTVAGTGTGTLTRYTGYATGNGNWNAAAQPSNFGVGGVRLAAKLSHCAFNYNTVDARNGLVTLRFTITDKGESVTLYHEVHVDNEP